MRVHITQEMLVVDGPKGVPVELVEIKQMNAAQGWHSGYLTRSQAKRLALALLSFAFTGKP